MTEKKFFLAVFFLMTLSLVSSQSAIDFMSTLFVITPLILTFKSSDWTMWKNQLNKFALFTVFWVAVSYLWNHAPSDRAWVGFLEFRWYLFFLSCICMWSLTFEKKIWTQKSVLFCFFTPLLVAGLYSILTYTLNYSPIHQTPADIEANISYLWRSGGLLNDPMSWSHTIGPVFVGFTVFSYLLFLNFSSNKKLFLWCLSLSIILGFTTLYTMTRGVWIACACALIVILFLQNYRSAIKFSVVGLIVGAALVWFNPTVQQRILFTKNFQTSHDSERLYLWKANLQMLWDHPMLGVGYGENRFQLRAYYDQMNLPENQFISHAHNQFIHFAAGLGVVGLLLYVSFLGYLIYIGLKIYKDSLPTPNSLKPEKFETDGKEQWSNQQLIPYLALAITASLLAFALGGMTEANFSIAKNRYFFLFVSSLLLALQKIKKGSKASDF